jgi:hypothetical protein
MILQLRVSGKLRTGVVMALGSFELRKLLARGVYAKPDPAAWRLRRLRRRGCSSRRPHPSGNVTLLATWRMSSGRGKVSSSGIRGSAQKHRA